MFSKICIFLLLFVFTSVQGFAADNAKRKPVKVAPMSSTDDENIQTLSDEDEEEEDAPARRPRPRARQKYDYSSEGRISRSQVGIELLGASILYSIHGSHLVSDQIALNAGLSYFTLSSSSSGLTYSASVSVTQIPLSVSYLFGGPDHHFEVLGGGDLMFASATVTGDGAADKATGSGFIPEIGAGYRYWPSAGGFHFRATLYGLFIPDNFVVWPGFSFGYAF